MLCSLCADWKDGRTPTVICSGIAILRHRTAALPGRWTPGDVPDPGQGHDLQPDDVLAANQPARVPALPRCLLKVCITIIFYEARNEISPF